MQTNVESKTSDNEYRSKIQFCIWRNIKNIWLCTGCNIKSKHIWKEDIENIIVRREI